MLPLLVVSIYEDRMLRAVLRVELEELGQREIGIQPWRLEGLAVCPLPGLHGGIVEPGGVLERHTKL